MSKFKPGGKKDEPEVSTASLPDIIFMLLFFFMVVTVMRESELKIKVKTPQATELTKLQEKSLVNYIHIGRPTKNYQEQYGTSPKIQLGDKISDIEDIIPIIITLGYKIYLKSFTCIIRKKQHLTGSRRMLVYQDIIPKHRLII